MGSTGTISYLLLAIEDSWRNWQGKKCLYLWKYVTESNRNKNPREAKLFVTKLPVYSMIANVVTFCTVVMKAISEE